MLEPHFYTQWSKLPLWEEIISHPPWTWCLSMIERNLWMFSCVLWFVYVMLRTGTEVHNVLLAFTYLPIVWDIWITCVFAVLEFFAAEDFTCTMSENLSSFHRPGIASTGTALLTGTPSSDVVKVNSGEDVLEPGWKPWEGEDHHQ